MGRDFDDCARTAQTAASKKLQAAICFSDSMMCLFALSNVLPKAALLARLISGLYGGPADPTRFTVNLGAKTLMTERAYNKMAGFTEEDNKLPAFFYTERAPSTGSVFDLDPYEMEVMLDF
jgi:aldehyde:ferredoxin oxidoreductase